MVNVKQVRRYVPKISVLPRWGIVSVLKVETIEHSRGGYTWLETVALIQTKAGVQFKTFSTDGSSGFRRMSEVGEQ